MSEFFNNPSPPTDQEQMRALQTNFELDQKTSIMEIAEELQTAARYLAGRLGEVDDRNNPKHPTDVTVMDPVRTRIVEERPITEPIIDANGKVIKPASSFKAPVIKGKLKVLKNVLRDQNKLGANFHHEEDPQPIGRGWVISTVKNRESTRTLILMEDGELYLGGSAQPAPDGSSKIVEAILDEEMDPGQPYSPAGHVNLSEYPVHPSFKTVSGYSETIGIVPQAVKDKKVAFDTEYSNVAVNLERIEHDMRKRGRELLGLPGRP